ncbi:pentafunctional AROM polypeptide [Plasmodium gonderi]|uniref:Pentafunctional AROM polypeptide n=1 Tax=Plasmodium gonderi TaxID=77519 RepID=A0A1Y1JAK6_PLAGO|nr:pentafunctional AROM polypeptide [Plasmodium gonderi]GAW79549.1 pentafunctional AROM polypeptide [Plasmodium gonderi]
MIPMCDLHGLNLFVEDDLGSFFDRFEKKRRDTHNYVILTDYTTFSNEQPRFLTILKFFLHDQISHSNKIVPSRCYYSSVQDDLKKCNFSDNQIFSINEKKWTHPIIPDCGDHENHVKKKCHCSFNEKYVFKNEKNNSELDRKTQNIDKITNRGKHENILRKYKKWNHCIGENGTESTVSGSESNLTNLVNFNKFDKLETSVSNPTRDITKDMDEAQIVVEKYEQIIQDISTKDDHLFVYKINNTIVIISNVNKYRNKFEFTQQLNEMFYDYRILRNTELISIHIHTNLLSALKEKEWKCLFTHTLKIAILNDSKLFWKIKKNDLFLFKKKAKYFLNKFLLNSQNVRKRGKGNKKVMNMFRFGNTIGNAIKKVRGNVLNGTINLEQEEEEEEEEDYVTYGIYYELKILYELNAVDMTVLIDVEEIMKKYKLKYKLETNFLNYYAYDIIHQLSREHKSYTREIELVYLLDISQLHRDVIINAPISVVYKVLCPVISMFPINRLSAVTVGLTQDSEPIEKHETFQQIEPVASITTSLLGRAKKNNFHEQFVHLEQIGNKSETIRVIYVSCMSRENICIKNVNTCLDVMVFIKILRDLKFDILLRKYQKHTTCTNENSGRKNLQNILLVRGNIQKNIFLFKNFVYQKKLVLNIYNCGTVCRFILPLLCLYICKQNLKAKERKKKVLKYIILKGNKQMESVRIISPLVKVIHDTFPFIKIKYLKKINYLPICITVKKEINRKMKLFCCKNVNIQNYHSSQFVSSMLLVSIFSDTDTCIRLLFKRMRPVWGRKRQHVTAGTSMKGKTDVPLGNTSDEKVVGNPTPCVRVNVRKYLYLKNVKKEKKWCYKHRMQIHKIKMHKIKMHKIKMHKIQIHKIQMHRIQMHRIQIHRMQMHKSEPFLKYAKWDSAHITPGRTRHSCTLTAPVKKYIQRKICSNCSPPSLGTGDLENDSTLRHKTKGRNYIQHFSTTSKSFIDLTIHIMKLWGVQVQMKNMDYFIKKRKKYPYYERRKDTHSVLQKKSIIRKVKRFMCSMSYSVVYTNIRFIKKKLHIWFSSGSSSDIIIGTCSLYSNMDGDEDIDKSSRFPTKRGSKKACRRCDNKENEISNNLVNPSEKIKMGKETNRYTNRYVEQVKCCHSGWRRSKSSGIVNHEKLYKVESDLGLIFYFIIGCLIKGVNCSIDLSLQLKGVELYTRRWRSNLKELAKGKKNISPDVTNQRSILNCSKQTWRYRKIKDVKFQNHIPNYSLLNILLLLGVDIYIKGTSRKSKKLYFFFKKKMNIRKIWIKRLLRLATSKRIRNFNQRNGSEGCIRGRDLVHVKYKVFEKVHIKLKLFSGKIFLEIVIDAENFSDDFFSLSILFCYYVFTHPNENILFKIKNIRNQNIKESIRIYHSVTILKLFFQNTLCILCNENIVYIKKMKHPIQNCLFRQNRINKKEKKKISTMEVSIQRQECNNTNCRGRKEMQPFNNSQYVINNKQELYIYVDTQKDHRIIFMITVLSLIWKNIIIDNCSEIEKSCPRFFEYANRYLGIKINYTTSEEINFCKFTKIYKYRLTNDRNDESSSDRLSPSVNSITCSSSSGSNNCHFKNKYKKPLQNWDHNNDTQSYKGGKKYVTIKIKEKKNEEKLHKMECLLLHPTVNAEKCDKNSFLKYDHMKNYVLIENGYKNSHNHFDRRYVHQGEDDNLGQYIEKSTLSKIKKNIKDNKEEKVKKSNKTDLHMCNTCGHRDHLTKVISTSTMQEHNCLMNKKREKSKLVLYNEISFIIKNKYTSKKHENGTFGKGSVYLPYDSNYLRKYKYEDILKGDDVNVFYLINQLNNLNINIICGIRNVGKSYLSRKIRQNDTLVIDIDEHILNGPISFDHLTIDDFRYYEYITLVSTLYLAYCVLLGVGGWENTYNGGAISEDCGEKEKCKSRFIEEKKKSLLNIYTGFFKLMESTKNDSQANFDSNSIFFSLCDKDIIFYNKKINNLYHLLIKNFNQRKEVINTQSVTIVLGGGIIEFQKSREVLKKLKNVILLKRSKSEIYHICMNDKIKPPLSGNLEEIINRRTVLFEKLNAFHFYIPPENVINTHIKNLKKSRNELIVSSFLNFFNYNFFLKPKVLQTYNKGMGGGGRAILSIRLTSFLSFNYELLNCVYDIVEVIIDSWYNYTNRDHEQNDYYPDLFELAIFIIRSYTDKPIVAKFPKWVLFSNFYKIQTDVPVEDHKKNIPKNISYKYLLRRFYKYKINIFDMDVSFFKKGKYFLSCKKENIFLIISRHMEKVHKRSISNNLTKLDRLLPDLIILKFAHANREDREILHLVITDYYENKVGNRSIIPLIKSTDETKRYEISSYNLEQNSSFVFLCNKIAHLGYRQQTVLNFQNKEREHNHPPHTNYMHSFYYQKIKSIITVSPISASSKF